MIGPFELKAVLYFTDGERVATAAFDFAVGVVPSKEDVNRAFDKAKESFSRELPGEWRLMTRHEFENQIIHDRIGDFGGHIEFATKEDWDD